MRLVDREKISINKNNFQQVMADCGLNLSFVVENTISKGTGTALRVDIPAEGMDSFKPENVASAVPALLRLRGTHR